MFCSFRSLSKMDSLAAVSNFTLALLLEKIILVGAREISPILGVRDTLEALAARLELIQALLSDAGRRNMGSQTIASWLKTLEVVASDGLNLLDKFDYIVLRGKVHKEPYWFTNISISTMLPKISRVKSKVDTVYGELLQMGLRLISDSNSGLTIKPIAQTDFSVIDSEVVGREGDVNNVVGMLLNWDSGEKISVISVVGMAGMGKTTLVQVVYNHPKVCRHFDVRMWVSVTTDFNGDRILREMLEHLTLKTVDVSSRGAILEMLRNKLRGRTYLLVLDDVWNENQESWDSMRKCLQDMGSSSRSKILVTTRNHRVASVMRSSVNYKLQLLPLGESLQLFQRVAFADSWPNQIPHLVDNMNRIVRRCEGLPLAIKTIGGLVYSGIKSLNLENVGTSWSPFETPNEILFTAFKPSYDSLPSWAVKQCFAYCSLFPKRSLLEKEKLVQLWMAQGFINVPPKQHQEMEDLGDEYFNLLTHHSMLEEVENVYGNIKSCKMHDLVHEFASSLSENFCLISEAGEADAGTLSNAVHLYLICRKRKTPRFRRNSLPMLRTLILEDGFLPQLLPRIEYVRVLIVTDRKARQLPSLIGDLKHLRYLDISRTSIVRLPNCITELYYLQTLRLYTLVEMPRSFGNLINLRHLHIENALYNDRKCLLPNIGELVNLRTIPFFVVSQEQGCQIFELGPLQFLKGELKIFGLENVKDGEVARRANLWSKSHIRSLELHWDSPLNRGVSNDEDILEGLRPNSTLQSLTIINFDGSRFSSWIAGTRESLLLSNLVTIKLQNCNSCVDLPALGHFPSLKVVQINTMNNVTYISEEFYAFKHPSVISSRFSVLEELTFTGMSNLRYWSDPPSAAVFPSLRKLTVKDCPQLTSLPEVFNCSPLRWLSITNCRKLNRLPGGLGSIVSLEYMEILHCNYLEEIPSIAKLEALRELSIVDCMKLRDLPTGIGECKLLRDLYILSCPLRQIDGDLHRARGLRKLEIGCFSDDLDYFPWPCSTSCITSSAEIANHDIQVLGLPQHFISLSSLRLCGWPKLTYLPEQVKHIPQLKNLHVCLFDGLEVLPEWLGEINSLATLILEDCWNLAYLPSAKLTNLDNLTILRCPLLEERCTSTTGAEWHKIIHIPHVYLGHREWESQT